MQIYQILLFAILIVVLLILEILLVLELILYDLSVEESEFIGAYLRGTNFTDSEYIGAIFKNAWYFGVIGISPDFLQKKGAVPMQEGISYTSPY